MVPSPIGFYLQGHRSTTPAGGDTCRPCHPSCIGPGRAGRLLSVLVLQVQREAEAGLVGTECVRADLGAPGHPAIGGLGLPRAAADEPVLAPFGHIALHVEKAPGVWLVGAD